MSKSCVNSSTRPSTRHPNPSLGPSKISLLNHHEPRRVNQSSDKHELEYPTIPARKTSRHAPLADDAVNNLRQSSSVMTSLAQHTPLESLLLLHALRSDGLTATRFGQISEQLKSIPLIRNDPTYDSTRLNEDALKHLCLQLLKDEVRNSLDQHEDRKRRQLSPTIPTVEEAAKHTHLISTRPSLVYSIQGGRGR
jgi:hypothetical protein